MPRPNAPRGFPAFDGFGPQPGLPRGRAGLPFEGVADGDVRASLAFAVAKSGTVRSRGRGLRGCSVARLRKGPAYDATEAAGRATVTLREPRPAPLDEDVGGPGGHA